VYNIDVALAVDRPTQLQVQLPANATVAIPRNEPTAPTPSGTNKIENGDDVKTVLVSLQNLPAGGTLVMGSSGPLPIGMDGRATLALTPGVHEVQITDSTGRIQRQTLTVQGANQDSTKTAVLPPPKPTAEFTPRPTPPPTAVAYPPQPPPTANAYTPQPVAGGQMMGGYPPPTKTWSPPPSGPPPMGPPQSAPGSDSGAKWLAAAISLFLLVGLAIAAYFVIRGPGRGPTRLSAADLTPTPTPRDIGAGQLPQYTPPAVPTPEPSLGISLEPTPYPSFEPTPYPSPSPSRSPQTKPTPKPEPSKGDIIGEEPRPERTPRQIQIPTPTPPPRPSPTRAIQEPLGDACLVVAVVGSGGRLRPGFAITCSELTGTGHPNSYGGRTGPAGRWRQCGMTPGHRVIVQVYDELGNARAGRQQVLSPGLNLIEVRVE
ncbi:MAG TPA: hypothetical protein VLZ81_16075, partial [Blastocatellia bacterium]|nr:hypothetical protein [Blastocatellia bacterium]